VNAGPMKETSMFPSYLKNPLVWPLLVPLLPVSVALIAVDRVAYCVTR